MIVSRKLSKNDLDRHLLLISETCIHRLPENVFLLSLRQGDVSNSTRMNLGPTVPFLYLKNSDILTQIQQKANVVRHLWWLVSKTRMHQLLENMTLLSLRQRYFLISAKEFFDPTPSFLYLTTVIFSLKFSKNDPGGNHWWLVSETFMHWLQKICFYRT